MNLPEKMKFGIFLGPFHRVGENPTLALERDMELIQWLDKLGYDEAWIGEHHSAGWEAIHSRSSRKNEADKPRYWGYKSSLSSSFYGCQQNGPIGSYD